MVRRYRIVLPYYGTLQVGSASTVYGPAPVLSIFSTSTARTRTVTYGTRRTVRYGLRYAWARRVRSTVRFEFHIRIVLVPFRVAALTVVPYHTARYGLRYGRGQYGTDYDTALVSTVRSRVRVPALDLWYSVLPYEARKELSKFCLPPYAKTEGGPCRIRQRLVREHERFAVPRGCLSRTEVDTKLT